MKPSITGIINDQRMLLHKSKKKHPESPKRVVQIMKTLKKSGYLSDSRVQFVDHYDRKANNQEIQYLYPQKYVIYIENLWPKASHRKDLTVLDTYFCQHSQNAARISAGGVLFALDKLVKKEWKNGYSIIRPPGHHSGYRNTINGFCIFNNVAIGAKYLQKVHGIKKIAIFDFDIHHGDGTQAVFDQDPNVLFISVHRYDNGSYYPAGDGHSMFNCGKGNGQGSKLNIPLNHGGNEIQAPGDNEYIYVYKRLIHPIINEFNPEFIIISAGYDACRNDPIGGFTVTPNAYYYMTRQLCEMGVPVLAVLQGGYNYKQTAWATLATVKALVGEQQLPQLIKDINYENIADQCHIENIYQKDIEQIVSHHSKYWKCLLTESLEEYSRSIKKNQSKKFGIFQQRQTSSSSQEQPEQTKPQPNPNKKKSNEPVYSKGLETADEDQSTNQFNFAAGHMQRFKNFSINSQQIHKWAYSEEIKFYQSDFPEKKFAPKYFGKEGDYIIIENLLYNQDDHIVVDIKLSRNSKKPELTEEKAQKLRKKEALSTTLKHSLRVSGFTTPTYKETGLLIPDQNFLRKILAKVVTSDNKQFYCSYLCDLIQTLKKTNRSYFNTSILLIKGKKKSNIGWIDFHYFYQNCQTYDECLVEGLENLIKFISEVQTTASK